MILILYTVPVLLISILVVRLVIHISTYYKIGSLPSPRKIHQKFIPLLGGLGFTVGTISIIILAQIFGSLPWEIWNNYLLFWIGLVIVLVTGIFDDIIGLNTSFKFAGEGVAAICLIIGGSKIHSFSGPIEGSFSLGFFSTIFTFIWILLIINAINLLDGLDGLAAGVSLIIMLGFAVIIPKNNPNFLFALSLGLIAGLLGFLKYNYYPAKIFMGDTGSLQLGYIIAFFSIESLKIAGSHQIYFLTALILLGVPLTDTIISFLRRLSEGKNPLIADKEHVHHRLVKLGLNHLQTVWVLYLFTALFVCLGVFMAFFRGISVLLLFSIALAFSLYWIWRLGYIETRFTLQTIVYQLNKSIPVIRRAPLHFNRIWHKLLLIFSDFIMLNVALFLSYWFKFHSGFVETLVHRTPSDYFRTPVFIFFTIGWMLLFWLNNLYQMDWDISRFDKSFRISKVVTFGIILLGFVTSDYNQLINQSQIVSLTFYWLSIIILVNGSRLTLIEIEKRFSIFAYAPKNTLIVGRENISTRILNTIRINPHLIFNVVGLVSRKKSNTHYKGLPVLGNYQELPQIIHEYKIDEVLLALPGSSSNEFIEILSLCEPQEVKIKIPPEVHDLYSGKNDRIVNHAYLEIFPENMVIWQWFLKRLFDLFISTVGLILFIPLFIIVAINNKINNYQTVFIKIPILGRNGIPFQMYVFRLSGKEYHFEDNPIYLGTSSDQELKNSVSYFLLKFRFYKIPQLINVLLGDMSLTGPRPEPHEWYVKFQKTLPFIYRRIYVKPGITGIAQIKYHYELTQKILQEMIKFDIFYVENMSLRLDVRILLRTLLILFRKSNKDITAQQTKKKTEFDLKKVKE